MRSRMTPSDLEVLIHCHVSLDQHPRSSAPAVVRAIKRFYLDGIINLHHSVDNPKDTIYNLTDKGRAWLTEILKTPMPRKVWANAKGEIIG